MHLCYHIQNLQSDYDLHQGPNYLSMEKSYIGSYRVDAPLTTRVTKEECVGMLWLHVTTLSLLDIIAMCG